MIIDIHAMPIEIYRPGTRQIPLGTRAEDEDEDDDDDDDDGDGRVVWS